MIEQIGAPIRKCQHPEIVIRVMTTPSLALINLQSDRRLGGVLEVAHVSVTSQR